MITESFSGRLYATLDENTVSTPDGYRYTAPDRAFYRHQWLWDSALTARAWAIHKPVRAADEIISLLERGQWGDGMVPNMILNNSRSERFFMASHRNPQAPVDHATSGITQPPLIAEATWETAKRLPHDDRMQFLRRTVGRIVRYHEWFYHTRDFNDDGLVSVVHPYETGMDNNPALVEHMASIDWRLPKLAIRGLRSAVAVVRQDTKHFPPNERAPLEPTTYATLVTFRLRHIGYDSARLIDEPFRVQDVHTNSILARNNDIVAKMAAESGEPLSDFLEDKAHQTRVNLEQLWNEEQQMYFSRDGITGEPIRIPTIASLMPLYAGDLPPAHEQALINHLQDPAIFGTRFGVPSAPRNSEYYREFSYWSRLVWPFTNHLLTDGLIRAGRDSIAEPIDNNFMSAVCEYGPSENFSPETGVGHGTANFSPTAAFALIIAQRRDPVARHHLH